MSGAAHAVNLSTVYGGVPLLERAAAARADGYTEVESWWDFDEAVPPRRQLDAFAASIEAADVRLIAMNSHGGDRARGERGLASLPDRQAEFEDSIASVVGVLQRLGAGACNVAAGNRDARWSPEEQDAVAADRYRSAAAAVGAAGAVVLIEPLGVVGAPDYPFRTGEDVVAFLEGSDLLGADIGLLFDTFHLTENGVDVLAAWPGLAPHVRHVQLADWPGRGAPGSGGIDFPAFLAEVAASGYAGRISLEYLPAA